MQNTATEGSYEDLNAAKIFHLMLVAHIVYYIEWSLDGVIDFPSRAHKTVSYPTHKQHKSVLWLVLL